MKANYYAIITNAIDLGIDTGWTHAHKHGEKVSAETVKEAIYNAITSEICEVIHFNDNTGE